MSTTTCRICGGEVVEFFEFGRQPVSNSLYLPEQVGREVYYRLAVGFCSSCTMVQQLEEVPRTDMFGAAYPFRTESSVSMSEHFEKTATNFLQTELAGEDPLAVEIGSNDGVLLKTISDAGVRHIGVDPSGGAAEVAARKGVKVHVDFFDERSAAVVREAEGPADLIFSSNTTSHIPYIDSVFRGVDTLLGPNGVFVVEDRYVGDIVGRTIVDQLYDEHFYLFGVSSVQAMAAHYGFELVDVEHLAVHGGSIRYTIARPGTRRPTAAVAHLLETERANGLDQLETYQRYGAEVTRICGELTTLITELRAQGKRVVGYGATAKSTTVLNYTGIGTDLLPYITDSTPEKQGRLAPGSHIPIVSAELFSQPYPDYAVLFAWSHQDEVLAKEREFAAQGGKWIVYVPDVHII